MNNPPQRPDSRAQDDPWNPVMDAIEVLVVSMLLVSLLVGQQLHVGVRIALGLGIAWLVLDRSARAWRHWNQQRAGFLRVLFTPAVGAILVGLPFYVSDLVGWTRT